MQDIKRDYVAPAVTKIGSFEEITQASNTGTRLDVALPSGADITNHLS